MLTVRMGRSRKLQTLLRKWRRKGFEVNRVAFHSLINGHCSLGQTEEAFGVVGLMSARGISSNVITNTLLIKGYCKQGKFEAAEKLLNSMK